MVLRSSGRGPPYPVLSLGKTAGSHGDKDLSSTPQVVIVNGVMGSWGHGVSVVYLHSNSHTHRLVIRLETVVIPMETKTQFSWFKHGSRCS